jgi:hypothetical protein
MTKLNIEMARWLKNNLTLTNERLSSYTMNLFSKLSQLTGPYGTIHGHFK